MECSKENLFDFFMGYFVLSNLGGWEVDFRRRKRNFSIWFNLVLDIFERVIIVLVLFIVLYMVESIG